MLTFTQAGFNRILNGMSLTNNSNIKLMLLDSTVSSFVNTNTFGVYYFVAGASTNKFSWRVINVDTTLTHCQPRLYDLPAPGLTIERNNTAQELKLKIAGNISIAPVANETFYGTLAGTVASASETYALLVEDLGGVRTVIAKVTCSAYPIGYVAAGALVGFANNTLSTYDLMDTDSYGISIGLEHLFNGHCANLNSLAFVLMKAPDGSSIPYAYTAWKELDLDTICTTNGFVYQEVIPPFSAVVSPYYVGLKFSPGWFGALTASNSAAVNVSLALKWDNKLWPIQYWTSASAAYPSTLFLSSNNPNYLIIF